MKILFVSDSSTENNIGQELEELVVNRFKDSNYEYKHYNVKSVELKKCVGCFNCWVATPGICIFKDSARDISREYISSDICILLSEIKYGDYSAEIKRVLDRNICNILPFFKEVNGEMHHAPRYDKYPQLVMLGYGSEVTAMEEKTFRNLNQANAINLQIEKAETYVCKGVNETEAAVNALATYLNVRGGEK